MRNYAPAEPGTDRLVTHILRALLTLTILALAGAAATQAMGGRSAAAVLGVVYLAWVLTEARFTAGSPTRSAAEHHTLIPYATARVTTALVAAYSAPAASVPVSFLLTGMFFAGIALRAWSIRELGSAYSHRVVRIDDGGLVCSGPYRVLRHPAYAGMLIANIGYVGYFASPAGIIALTLLVAAILWRIRVEERVLLGSPGYREFSCSRDRLVPGVW
ncbi:hypothetical protein A9W98_20600 [Mycobacterium gordonae]|jgi:protein-S-isoprenylcysteine O-methyltransferase Ste14|uniref:Isoprenylcysteine carboxylmethyltransferase family protein n=1 Tax=Mycobacterium gordonae TaxID=1778 RepID=A0A1A6BG70_MYCGO|nr:isoprenylcysteine carboxylmethyltransferase family protein [Mycobacterium gordonae]MBI2701608.1 hypothetical protein [Mycobacterium sp.]OBS01362.1 hypothetical protein A9W98_20600 [Mycobacterium gordonae]